MAEYDAIHGAGLITGVGRVAGRETLMIVLGWYGDLYEAVPQKINVTVQGILEKIQSAAAAEAEFRGSACRRL